MKNAVLLFLKTFIVSITFFLISIVLLLSVSGVRGNGSNQEINSLKNQINSPFQSPLTRGRFALVKSIVDANTVIIDRYATTTLSNITYYNGHYYSAFTPGTAFLAVPLYALGEKYNLGVLTTNVLGPIVILLIAITMFATLRILDIKLGASLLSICCMVFATGLFTFSTTLNAYYLSALSVTLAVSATVITITKKQWLIGFPIYWLAFGLGLIVDYSNAVILLPFGILLALNAITTLQKNGRNYLRINVFIALSSITACIFILPLMLYIYNIFGTYTTTTETHQINGIIEQGKMNYHLTVNPTAYLNKKVQYKKLNLSEQSLPLGLFTKLVSPAHGLFIYSSLFLISFYGFKPLYQKNKNLFLAITSTIIITIILYSSYGNYGDELTYGSHFFVGIVPLFTVLIGFALQKYIQNTIFLITFTITAIYSIGLATLGTITTTEKYVSFAYDYYIKTILTKEQFLLTIIATLYSALMFLIIVTIVQSERKDRL